MQGKTINGYTLQRLLGTGGMAEVWYAENAIEKQAAVKILLSKLCADDNVIERFKNEAKVMVKLNHPNIRQVYDYGYIDGRPAIVMEYLEGDDLKARMKRGQRFSDEELKKWWDQLVDALNYTHAKGVVHRDIKPSNIFIDKQGDVKLLDFGIAKIKESISMTQTGAMMGTLMYMSPEQVEDSKHIGPQSDIYSLAVTFVHLLTSKAPYDSTTSSDYKIRKGIVEEPLDMSGVPAEWQAFLTPYLAKDASQRPKLRAFEVVDSQMLVAEVDASDHTMVEGEPLIEIKAEPMPKKAVKEAVKESPAKPKRKSKGKTVWLWIGVAAAIVAAVVVLLFGITGIKGQVFDRESYYGVPYATVVAANMNTGKEYYTVTDENGCFNFSFMRPGYYQVYCSDMDHVSDWEWERVRIGSTRDYFYLYPKVRTFSVNGVSFKMKYLDGGTFFMGAQDEDPDEQNYDSEAWSSESPVHEVNLSPFFMGETEVTQALWEAVMDDNPSNFRGPNLPVESVSWDECQEFIEKLNRMTGEDFRLPTEAEWEYAARGGTNTALYNGEDIITYSVNNSPNLDPLAWYGGNCGRNYTASEGCDMYNATDISDWESKQYPGDEKGGTHPVGRKQPNAYGLYDMLGNVAEYCQDWYGEYSSYWESDPQGPSEGDYHVLRGGAYYYYAKNCRVSKRYEAYLADDGYGLRLCLPE